MPLSNEKYQVCPICGGDRIHDKHAVNRFNYAKCDYCKLLFVREQLSQDYLDNHYNLFQDEGKDDVIYLDQENNDNLNHYYAKLKSHIKQFAKDGQILDVGCNAGQFLDQMKGFDCYGVERSKKHAMLAKSKYGNNIFIGSIEEYNSNIKFDCITLQDMLDHTVDPLSVVKKCYTLLKPGGLIVIKVHDSSCLLAKITGGKFYALIPPEHLYCFSRKSLRILLKKSSFQMVETKHISHILKMKTAFLRLSRGESNMFYSLYEATADNFLGNIPIRKNFRDIITVFAKKDLPNE